jgi:hypothetical protein
MNTFEKISIRALLTFSAVAILLFAAGMAPAQMPDSVPKKRLKSPAAVRGFVGGEAHHSYVVRARKGQTLTVRISWIGRDRKAQFMISRSADFFAGDLLQGGRETYDGRSQSNKIRATSDYYIYVTAHPTANYLLKVTVK